MCCQRAQPSAQAGNLEGPSCGSHRARARMQGCLACPANLGHVRGRHRARAGHCFGARTPHPGAVLRLTVTSIGQQRTPGAQNGNDPPQRVPLIVCGLPAQRTGAPQQGCLGFSRECLFRQSMPDAQSTKRAGLPVGWLGSDGPSRDRQPTSPLLLTDVI